MKLKVLTTSRQIREYVNSNKNNILPKLMCIGEFLDRVVVVDGKKFVDDDLRKVYLYKAIENVDISKLGISDEFMSFFKSSEFILGFFNEVYLEKVNLDDVDLADTYTEYMEHISILKEIYNNYKTILQKNGFVDKITIDEYRINEKFLSQFSEIELEVLGYLTKFDLDVLSKIKIPLKVKFRVSEYNKSLIKKMFGDGFDKIGEYIIDFVSKMVLEFIELKRDFDVEVSYFSDRINQVNFVFAAIEELVNSGCNPEKIAVILPDEEFGEYLKLFKDEKFNLNFAFGDSFRKSNVFVKLKALFDYFVEKDEVAYEKIKDIYEEFEKLNSNKEILDFIYKLMSNKEKKIADDEIFKIKKLLPFLDQDKAKFLHFLIDRFSDLSFDDVDGGLVTTMGVLEARGMEFDGVIIVDFNEGVVPNVSDKDFFLNSVIRKRTNLPTRADKEALQKNYYYNLFINSKKVKLSYVKNEENTPSRFLYELGLSEGENRDFYYDLFKKDSTKTEFSYDGREFELSKKLTPTRMYDLLTCTRKYYFKYVLQIENSSNSEENFGSLLHKIIEEVVRDNQFTSSEEYYNQIMDKLLQNRSKKEIFEIRSKWEDRIRNFCEVDFQRAKQFTAVEGWGEKKLNDFILSAKFDRTDDEFVYDYKTGDKNEKDTLQGLFYNYIFEKEAVFYYLKDDKKIEYKVSNENAKKELEEKLASLKGIVRESDDIKHCKWCEFRFVCRKN